MKRTGECRMTSEGSFAPSYGSQVRPFPGASPSAESPQTLLDAEHLRLLRIGYFISAGQTAIFIPVGLLYASMGFLFSHLPGAPPAAGAAPAIMTWFFGAFGAVFALVGIAGT